MDFVTELAIMSFIAYLIGSIPFGLILTKIFTKQDIRSIGSGNIGATNVLRTGNKKLAAATLFLDAMKGLFGIGIALSFAPDKLLPHSIEVVPIDYVIILLIVIGHCFPIWINFKGGKGVATAIGGFLFIPYINLAVCCTWLAVATIFRISSLSALIAIGVTPILTLLLYGTQSAIICALITALIWVRHKENIKRLIKGTEPKIGAHKKKKEEPREPVSE